MTARPIKHKDWIAEACTLFGNDMVHWVFVCPVCEHEAFVRRLREGAWPSAPSEPAES